MPIRHAASVDVLADVLSFLRIRGEVICRSVFVAPWGITFGPGAGHFHVVERGTMWVAAPGAKPKQLRTGDLVVLARGRGHRIADARDRRAVAFESIAGAHYEHAEALLRYGGARGRETHLVCGTFRFGNPLAESLLRTLPDVLHVPGAGLAADRADLLVATVPMLIAEAASRAPGADLTTSRLIDLLFVRAVRGWLEGLRHGATGWIGALRDPNIGRALGMLHARPERNWDVASLAAEVGMSRSPFAAKFAALVGEPPVRYLTRWRMNIAADLLASSPPLAVRQVAARVGYEAEEAFSRAFKRQFGVAPSHARERKIDTIRRR